MLRLTAFATVLAIIASSSAWGHHAPSGWKYPYECCSNIDCRPVECDSLEEIEDGKVRDIDNGQTYESKMVQPAGDGHCHVCTEGGLTNGKPLCVFVQNGS